MLSFILDSNDLPRIVFKDKVYVQFRGRRGPLSALDSMQGALCRVAPNEPGSTIATAVRSGQCIRPRSSILNSAQRASTVELLVLKLQRACEGICNAAIRYFSARGETLRSMWLFFPTPESQSPVCSADGRFPHPLGVCTLQSAGSDENGAEQTVATQPPCLHASMIGACKTWLASGSSSTLGGLRDYEVVPERCPGILTAPTLGLLSLDLTWLRKGPASFVHR
ncbi:hypothetical protein CT0861_05531 [Colletotrichum tofieldiae]|uniref:Uncharacterized protein n=1 Tax=Colletotrichum tofieldiae TaxID=708197 RepID=A0A166MJV2_9PEZI|nr:hypothetical protein CT0861_05531 [Colletotrichum tofieldiae]